MNEEPTSRYLPSLRIFTSNELIRLADSAKFREVFLSELSRRDGTHKPNGQGAPGASAYQAAAPERIHVVKITYLSPGKAKANPVTQAQRDQLRKSLTRAERQQYAEYLDSRRPEIEAADAEKRQLNLLAANRARLQSEEESGTGITGGGRKKRLRLERVVELEGCGTNDTKNGSITLMLDGRKGFSVTSASGAGIRTRPPVDRGSPLKLSGIHGRVAELWQGGLPIKLGPGHRRPAGCILDIVREEYPAMDFSLSEIRNLVHTVQRKIIKMTIKKERNSDKSNCNG